MKLTVYKKREIKLEKLLYQEYLRKTYIVYNYPQNRVNTKRKTDYTYKKWRAQKFMTNRNEQKNINQRNTKEKNVIIAEK